MDYILWLLLLYEIILNLILSIDLHGITLIFSNSTIVKLGELRSLAKHSCIGDTVPCTSCPTDCTPHLTILSYSYYHIYCQWTRIQIRLPSNCTTLAQHSQGRGGGRPRPLLTSRCKWRRRSRVVLTKHDVMSHPWRFWCTNIQDAYKLSEDFVTP